MSMLPSALQHPLARCPVGRRHSKAETVAGTTCCIYVLLDVTNNRTEDTVDDDAGDNVVTSSGDLCG